MKTTPLLSGKNNAWKSFHPSVALVLIFLFLASASSAPAALKTWLGTGGTGNWSTPANWSPINAPANGDDLSFPAGAGQLLNTNNLVRNFSSIAFSGGSGGYIIRGNAITLTNGLTAAHTAGLNTVELSITNGASQTITATTGGTLAVNGAIVFNGFNLTVNNTVAVNLAGLLSGTGNLTKTGSGNLLVNGSVNNTYTGTTTVNAGTLELNDTSSATAMVPGDLTINNGGTVLLSEGNQIADTADVTVNGTGLLNLPGLSSETIATLTMTGGTVSSDLNTLTCGNITTLASATQATINGSLTFTSVRTLNIGDGVAACDLIINAVVVGAGGIIKTGSGTLCLDGPNTYAGATTINAGLVSLDTNTGLGSSAGGVTVNSNAVLLLNNAHVTNEVLTLNSTNPSGALQVNATGDWIGPITLSTDVFIEASSLLQLGGLISGPGGFTKISSSTLRLIGTNVNTYAGNTIVNGGTLELNVNANNGAIPGDLAINGAFTVRLLGGDQFNNSSIITINTGGVLDFNGQSDIFGGLVMTGGTAESGAAGLLRLNGNVTVNASATQSTISGNLQLFGTAIRTFDIVNGTAIPDLLVSAVISSSGGITVNGFSGGRVDFSGANTYSGLTTLNDAFLLVQHASGLGSTAAGTVLNGSNLTIDGVTVSGEGLTSIGASALQGVGASGWTGPIVLNAQMSLLANVVATTFDLSGVISGTGGITKVSGLGTVIFSGASANTYTGPTTVNQGILELGKTLAISASSLLTIGDSVGGVNADIVRYTANNGINSSVPILINESGLLDLNGFSDFVGALTLIGGDITTGAGTLTMNNNLTASCPANPAKITGNLALGSATRTFTVTNAIFNLEIYAAISGTGGIIKNGSGIMSLINSNAFTGAVTVNQGGLLLADDFAAGTTAGGVSINADATLRLNGINVGNELLTLNSTASSGAIQSIFASNSWAGAIALAANTVMSAQGTGPLNLLGAISGPGALTKIDTGTLIFSGGSANTYAGVTTVNAGTLVLAKSIENASMTNNLVIGDGSGGANADVVRTEVNAQLPNTVAVTVNSSGLFEITQDEAIGSLAGSGNVVINTIPASTLAPGFNNSSTVFSGVISGPGGFTKSGTGAMTLSDNNTYIGTTRVNEGTLLVNGSQPQSHVTIGGLGILGGSGTVGNITNTLGGSVVPGTSPGTLTSSNVVFSGASSDFNVELTGLLPGVNYDQLNVRGSNSLGGATLNVTAIFGSSNAPIPGATFTILNNDAAEAITGTFAGLADNAVFTASGMQFRIDYDGGTGNDVVLTFTNAALAQTAGASISTGNGNGTVDPNECNYLNIVITNTAADATTNIVATLYSDTPGVTVTQPFSSYPNIAIGGKRTNSTPFQISTAPTFVCGTNIQLRLVVQTGNHGTFAVPGVINSGSAGVPVSFVNNIATPIPDLGTVNRLFSVSGIVAPVGRVEVSFQISHTSDADLDIFLVGPDGTRVELTTDNGGTFDDYGTDCSVSGRTRFSDLAATAITVVSPPFAGTFRPEGSLSAFIGKSGSAVNGTWTLEITDDAAGALGTINCATVFVYPATCAVGSGACELCPEVTINGFVGIGFPAMSTDRLTRNGLASASTCGVVDLCPGPIPDPGNNYEVHTFYNGPSNACITVTLGSALADVFSSAYLGSFNPTNVCLNYLADAGTSTAISTLTPYSFDVPANAVFAIVVNTINGLGGSYTLQVSGGDCRPELNITSLPGNKALLDWTTAATGYNLESTNALVTGGSSIWPPVTNIPVVINSRFAVTNNVTSSNQFYHLRKP